MMKKPLFQKSTFAVLICAALSATHSYAVTLNDVASQTVLTNPEVTSKWRSFRASTFERDVTWGRNLPTLDVLYGVSRQNRDSPMYNPPGDRSYTNQNGKISLKQNLFEGFATLHDTKRLEHATMVRFYEMLDASESAAYEAARAYIDVWRYRQLVAYAEENYVAHRVSYEKVKLRAQSGVSGNVDLETAAGRLALAEANLLTEKANLHDVSARYQRVVGELPPADMAAPPASLTQGMPASVVDGINQGYENSPRLKAAYENILSAKRNVEVQKAGNMPRVDAYMEMSKDKNASGFMGTTDERTAGLSVSWNLFRGFQDKARTSKAVEEVFYSKDMREKECRSVRQDLSMSVNEFMRLKEQMTYQDQHMLSTDKVREAFRDQFGLGKRTLLDVLDIENEYYTARRNYFNSEMDMMAANAKYFATAGELLNKLNLKNLDMTPPNPVTRPDDDMMTTCPAEGPEMAATDKDGLFRKAWVEPPPMVPKTVKKFIETTKPVIIYGANFDFDSDRLKPSADEKLQTVVDFARDFPMANMDVVGHTDWVASDEYNLDLSKRRAEAVKKWLVDKGVAAERINVRYAGEAEPMATNETAEGRAQNRRVEIHYSVTEKREMDTSKM